MILSAFVPCDDRHWLISLETKCTINDTVLKWGVAPRADDSTLARIILSRLDKQDERQDKFACEVKESLRAGRVDSHNFREEVLERVQKIETNLAVNTAITQAVQKQKTGIVKFGMWAVGVGVAVASTLLPLLWGRL